MSGHFQSMDLRSRLGWMMGALAIVAALGAVGVGLNGYLNRPRTTPDPARVRTEGASAADDPLAPRIFDKTGQFRVHVAGAVKRPGVYALPDWSRVVDAVKKAGGALPSADLDAINLADRIRDAEQIRIPFRGRSERSSAHAPTADPGVVPLAAGGVRSGRYPFAASGEPKDAEGSLDLNQATL
ncbi:MAG: hypothetical protein FJX77_08810, partial [Armatimonadetes bacterium]|nr:hypothetical protein [Armatimonadota bacterium]